MGQKQKQNYLDLLPARNPKQQYHVESADSVTIIVEWKGFYHRIAQKVFKKPAVSRISLDTYGSFLWLSMDGETTVFQLLEALKERFPEMEKPLPRLIQFMEILHSQKLMRWKRSPDL